MKSRLFSLLLALCLLLTVCGCDSAGISPSPSEEAPGSAAPAETAALQVSPTPELSQREKDWIEDIEFLREEFKAKHMDPFYLCSEDEFDWKLDQLSVQAGQLSDADISFEIISLIAGIGDPHSFVKPTASLFDQRFPATAHYYDGRLYLTAFQEGFEQLEPYLLREIVAVNGVDIAYLNKKVDSIGNPFNSWASREAFQVSYFIPAFFDWAGCDYIEGYAFQVVNDNREVELVEMPVVTSEEYGEGKWCYPENWKNKRAGNYAEYMDGENGGYVYVAADLLMPGMEYSLKRLAESAGELLATHPECRKLVVDLRGNPGGDASLVEAFQENAQLLGAEHIYVLTDGMTASASMTFAAFFKNELGALIVGEPTGQFTAMFHMQSSVDKPSILPNSQIVVQISNSWHDGDPIVEVQYDENGKLYEWESTILPDVFVYQDIEDIRQGKDSVIEWVLAQ